MRAHASAHSRPAAKTSCPDEERIQDLPVLLSPEHLIHFGLIAGSPVPDDLLEKAARAGFPILDDPTAITPDPRAVRMLPSSETALGVSFAGDVLEVVLAEAPSPARLRQLADATGMLVTVRITTPAILDELRLRIQPAGAAPPLPPPTAATSDT